MKIFSAAQIREADAYTIANEPVSSLHLMERAAGTCAAWIMEHYTPDHPFYIFCGMGNNGGDGLAITRLLLRNGYNATAWLLQHSQQPSADNLANQAALLSENREQLREAGNIADLPEPAPNGVIVDAIFGTGLSRPVEGWMAGVIHRINDLRKNNTVISIDIPSGMMADTSSRHMPVIQPHHTLSFECFKLAFLLPENAATTGRVHLLQIGLHPQYLTQTPTRFHISDAVMMQTIYRPRDPFGHKGTYGHALLIAGSYGKMGAAVLSAGACLRAGVGLLTCYVPACGYNIMQISEPCAMCITDVQNEHSTHFHEIPADTLAKYSTIGIGPGIGTAAVTAASFEKLLARYRKPMVLDADALNLLSVYPFLLDKLPAGSILTPHPKEFERLFGSSLNDVERLDTLSRQAVERHLYILLKGRFTAIACPDGAVYFNSTGNPGMATGGSGDVLTGILAALLAQGYASKAAVLLGTYLHGLAGDMAAAALSPEAMTAADITAYLGKAYQEISK